MTDLILALKIAETIAESVPETKIHLKNVPREYVRHYVMSLENKEVVRRFENRSEVRVTVLPF